ncbi:The (Largely Archaeal Putative) Hydrophobe/Amphiphile Efflux-3 (HAE3) Family [Dehalogenimonas alkenigignens]|uniref:The (Largely Archaeal Putative) Hydrophobe/Amphiphile Efflux-3 (HAE3) Family n=1 Tax=Dehalogenimonas alkenigignens TaxID=1217799 RepID=A0A0W0GK33_9CHLR|nr:hydrophobe/amphiphile efflux-3 (HAE3) family transporter [Dehalogenimonas alkenigignens]KTB48934.1 The (Largely Archaeal Putative) Hydrophobe/Amphiphile Efflux-3 (HAE3) Family [Dehalogenimonas alkenigignens]
MNGFFRKLGLFIEVKRGLVIAASVLLLLAALVGASRLSFATGIETMISTDSQVYRDYQEFNKNFGAETVIILARAEGLANLVDLDNLTAVDSIEQQLSKEAGVLSVVGPGFALRQAMAQIAGAPVLPPDQATLEVIMLDSRALRSEMKHFFPTDNFGIVIITMEGGTSLDQVSAVVDAARAAIGRVSFNGIEASVTGASVIFAKMEELMTQSMSTMIGISMLLMLIILAAVFAVRGFFAWRWLPLGAVIIGSIYAFGMMGWLSVPITMVTMAILPILIGLGVDYAVQFHNRYDEEARRGETVAEAIIDSVTHIGPAILIAIIAACLGFAALFLSPVPMIRQFGMILIIGVIACYLVSLFILLPVLYSHDRRKKAASKTASPKDGSEVGIVERALAKLAPRIIRNPVLIISVAAVFTVIGIGLDSRIETETDENKYISQDLPLMKDFNDLAALSGGSTAFNIMIRADDVTELEVLEWMQTLEGRLLSQSVVPVLRVDSIAGVVAQAAGGGLPSAQAAVNQILEFVPELAKANLLTGAKTLANVTVMTAPGLSTEDLRGLRETVDTYLSSPPAGVTAVVTGQGVIGIELMDSLTTGRVEMTLLGIGLVFLGLFVLFRFNAAKALIATLPIAMIIGWSSVVMYFGGIKYTALTATLGSLIIGIGVEFTILMMMRYQEERQKGAAPGAAMTTAMTKIGRAVITSGLTVVGGFGALLFARDFPILTDFGAVTMINVGFALVSSLVVLPTIIVAIDLRKERKLAKAAAG